MKIRFFIAASLLAACQVTLANEWIVSEAAYSKGAAGYTVGFAGDGTVMDAMVDLSYDAAAFSAKVSAANGASCTIHPDGGVVRVITPISDKALGKSVTALCQVSLISNGSKTASSPTLTVSGSECARGIGIDASCDLSSATAQK